MHAPIATANLAWLNLNGKASGATPPAVPASDFVDLSSAVGGMTGVNIIPMIGNKINIYAVGAAVGVTVDFITYR